MTGVAKLVNTIKSCVYVVNNKIDGDFVECGVWRGGSCIAAGKIFELIGSEKQVWAFDTFEGMTEPSSHDEHIAFGASGKRRSLIDIYKASFNGKHSEWAFASLEDVTDNIQKSGLNLSSFRLIRGDVCQTLKDPKKLPNAISVLRLDTDWYESSFLEMEVLYPLLSKSGVFIQDDYGHFSGAKKAVDEYFTKHPPAPMLSVVDYACRVAIKVRD